MIKILGKIVNNAIICDRMQQVLIVIGQWTEEDTNAVIELDGGRSKQQFEGHFNHSL